MKTKIYAIDENNIDDELIEEAGNIIRNGGLVAFPTETVYGLGADALNESASYKIYEAKGRPSDNPLIVHIASYASLMEITTDLPDKTKEVADRFWPGPLTMIFNKNEKVPLGTTGGLETVAVRMPSNPISKKLIEVSGGFVAAPSANTSGRPSPTTAAHVIEDLSGKIDAVIDGGMVNIGVESTILDMTVEPAMILRPGAITKNMLEEVLGLVAVDSTLIKSSDKIKPKAPGMKYRHYAPKANLTIVEGDQNKVIYKINQLVQMEISNGKSVGIIATKETCKMYTKGIIKSIGSRKKEETIARHLYQVLREFDDEEVDVIYSEAFDTSGIGIAIMNRLLKAAGHHIIQVK
ncbi:MAG: L-threonylcarbamoyladenylate synthase [Suipraeoptans sp.]